VVTDGEHILACSGWSQALDLTCRVLADQGVRTIGMEDPCIAHYRDSVRANGLAITPLPVDDDGARLDAVGDDVGAIVLTPAHQYPSGPTLAPERRAAAVAWARRTGGIIIEDDYDGELRYDRQPVGALQSLAPEHVAYVGTAAKSLAPGLRLGWMAVPEVLREGLTRAKYLADRNTSVLDQLALATMVTSGAYDRQLRRARLRDRRRRDLLLDALASTVPGLRASGIAAGLHVVLDLEGRPEGPVIEGLAAREVAVAPLSPAFHDDPPPRTGLVVGYGTPAEHAFPAALDALTTGLAELG
jgi:GntR family transcriptional regulator/MocR family aminotransferase